MQKIIPFGKRIYELKKTISILEWDISLIQNDQLKAIKEEQLLKRKRELQGKWRKYFLGRNWNGKWVIIAQQGTNQE